MLAALAATCLASPASANAFLVGVGISPNPGTVGSPVEFDVQFGVTNDANYFNAQFANPSTITFDFGDGSAPLAVTGTIILL
jgi:hypothetical protein